MRSATYLKQNTQSLALIPLQ